MGSIPKILLITTLLTAASTPVQAADEIEVELLNVGPGDDLYAAFGHTALLVLYDGSPRWVYNFGYTNFEQPNLVLRFLRGQAVFHVGRQSYRQMKQDCRDEDRSMWRQALALTPDQHRAMVRELEHVIRPENKRYRYHHYTNNCATRPRDLIDRASGGKVARAFKSQPASGSIRETTRRGFAGRPAVLYFMDHILGRPGDRVVTRWQEAFYPPSLSWSLQQANLAGEPMEVLSRQGPELEGRDPHIGVRIQCAVAAAAALLGLALAWLLRRRSRWAGLPLLLLALPAALLGLFSLGLAIVSDSPELRSNELIFSYWPADLLLLWPALRWLRGRVWAGGVLRLYALFRLVTFGWLAAGHLSGALVQRPLTLLVLPAALALALWWGLRRLPTAPGASPSR